MQGRNPVSHYDSSIYLPRRETFCRNINRLSAADDCHAHGGGHMSDIEIYIYEWYFHPYVRAFCTFHPTHFCWRVPRGSVKQRALPISSSKSTAEGNMKRNCYDRVGIVREQFVFANVELLPSSLFICFFFFRHHSFHVWAFLHYCISFLMINLNSFRNEFKLIIIYFLINFCKINYYKYIDKLFLNFIWNYFI